MHCALHKVYNRKNREVITYARTMESCTCFYVPTVCRYANTQFHSLLYFCSLVFLLGYVLWRESLSQRLSLCDWYIQHFSVYLWKYHQGRVKETQTRLWLEVSHHVFICLLPNGVISASVLPLTAIAVCREKERKREKEIHITLLKRLVILLELFKSYIPCKIQISTWLKWENWKMRKGGVLEKQLKLGWGRRGKLSLSGI